MRIQKNILFFVLLSFSIVLKDSTDYQRDLKLVLATKKFGVNNDDVVSVSLMNSSSSQEYKISYLIKQDGAGCELYLHFRAFMLSQNGEWSALNNKIDKQLGLREGKKKRAISLRPQRKLDLLGYVFYPKKWFDIGQRKGKLKLVAEYDFRKIAPSGIKDTALLNIPSFKILSDTLVFLIK